MNSGGVQLSAGCAGLDVLTPRCGSLPMSPAVLLVSLSLSDLLADPKRNGTPFGCADRRGSDYVAADLAATAMSGIDWTRESEPVEALRRHFLEGNACF